MNRYPNDPRMVVYQILNLTNGKSYVGQAMNGFYRRYDSYSWWKGVENNHLKHAIAKYGVKAFEIHLLETNVSSLEELNHLESEHIVRLDCIYPKGYNYQDGGQKRSNRGHHPETRKKMALLKSGGKTYRLLNNLTGTIHEFVNITQFAKDNGLARPTISTMLARRESVFGTGSPYYSQHREWSLPETPIRRILCISPSGEEHIVLDGVNGGIKGFCKRMGFACSTNVFAAIAGRVRRAYGWTFRVLDSSISTS